MWYDVLKVSKYATRIEVDMAYHKLSSDPSIRGDLNRALEIKNAYTQALQCFDEEGNNIVHVKKQGKHSPLFIMHFIVITTAILITIGGIIKVVIFDRTNEIADCLSYKIVHNDGFDQDKINELMDGYRDLEVVYSIKEDVENITGYYEVDGYDVWLEMQNGGTRGWCTLYVEHEEEIEIDGKTMYFDSYIATYGEGLDTFLVTYRISENKYGFDYVFKEYVDVEVTKDQLNFVGDYDNDVIDEYYNYEYVKEIVDLLYSEVEGLEGR